MSPGPGPTSVPSGILTHPAVWHNRNGPKLGEGGYVPFLGGGLGPHLTQSRLGRGLPPYQVAYWTIGPCSHLVTQICAENWRLCPYGEGGGGSPSNTRMWADGQCDDRPAEYGWRLRLDEEKKKKKSPGKNIMACRIPYGVHNKPTYTCDSQGLTSCNKCMRYFQHRIDRLISLALTSL